jgi:plastocyanin
MRKLIVIALIPLGLAFAPSASADDLPLLVGTVGPGFTIDLADANGKHVDELVAGRYTLLVHDLSDIHNFVLGSKRTGERLATTEVEFVGDMTFTITLTPGLYAYACSPHFQTMNGHLQVMGTPSPTPSSTPAPVTMVKKLAASVGATKLSLSARRATHGLYRLTVADRSRTRNFHLIGPGLNRRTGAAFTGTVTWTVRLARGTYRFGSDPALTGRLVVA